MQTEPATTAPHEVRFTEWTPWSDRRRLRTSDPQMGVYLWARFEAFPTPTVHPWPDLPETLVYVGEANNLNKRPLASDHHGIEKYHATFPDDMDLSKLYVAVFRYVPFTGGLETPKHRVYTQFLEAQISWEYVLRYGRPVALYYKKGKYGH